MPPVLEEVTKKTKQAPNPETARLSPNLPDPGFGCVFLASSAQEAEMVSSMVESERIRIYHAETLEDAVSQLRLTRSRVLLTNTKFRDGNWKEALQMSVRVRPQPALVVASRLADEKLWLGVMQRGAYDLIVKPFRAEDLCRVLQNAHTHASTGGLRHMTA